MKIILISLDTTRLDRLGCYGYPSPTSPYLDQIAAQGALWERAYASDIPTEVAHTGVFTGRVGLSTGVVAHGSSLTQLAKGVPWLPALLRNQGFVTGAVDNLYQLKEWFARGYRYYVNSSAPGQRWIDGRTVNDLAKAWIGEHKGEDFFLFLHYWDPHTPYLPPPGHVNRFYAPDRNPKDPDNKSMERAYNHRAYPFFKHHHYDLLGGITDSAYMNALYDAELRYLDDLLQELDEFLAQQGIVEETFLILFGDHGESLDEHDIFWDHCGLYEPTVHVPMIMRWPNRIPPGRRIPGLVQQVDLLPTILEAAGCSLPGGLDGKSLWPSIRGETEGTQDRIYLSECAWQASRGVVTRDFKFIRTVDSGPFVRPRRELYDLRVDGREIQNIAESSAQVADELERLLDEWVDRGLAGRPDPMGIVLREQGLPFRRRISEILQQVGMTWEQWSENPDRAAFDEAQRRHAR